MLRPSSSVPSETFRLTARPLATPTSDTKSERRRDEYVAVPLSPVPNTKLYSSQRRIQPLPLEAMPPSQQFDSRDRFVDDAVHINAVPRSRVTVPNAGVQFDELHQLYHDLLLGFYYNEGNTTAEPEEAKAATDQRQRQRERRQQRRTNPRIAYMLKRLLPLISQGLNELGHATVHRQESLEKILPQSTKSKAFIQPPGGAVTWLARYLVRNNPTHNNQDMSDSASMASYRLQRQYSSVLAQCLREYDAWQLCMEHREAMENVNLRKIWQSIDTNEDGTLDISEVGNALQALGFQLTGQERKDTESAESAESKVPAPAFAVGNRVRARFAGKGHFYPADISALNQDGTYKLLYLDGDWEDDAKQEHMELVGVDKQKQKQKKKQQQQQQQKLRPPKIKKLTLDLNEMKQLFDALDCDGSGDVDFDEFVLGAQRWFLGREALAKAIFDRNLDAHHAVDSADMALLLQELARKRMIRSLQNAHLDSKKLFNKIDLNQDGYVDLDEFAQGISQLASAMHELSEHNQIDLILQRKATALFKEIDQDGDGLINLVEFQAFVVNFLDQGIEERANKAAQRIRDEQDTMIQMLKERGTVALQVSDKRLAKERARLDTCRLEQLAVIRPAVARFQIEVEGDANQAEQTLLNEAIQVLSECIKTASNAEHLCDVAQSDLIAAHNALSVALGQATSATRLADLKNTVNQSTSTTATEAMDMDPTPIDLAMCSVHTVTVAVDDTIAVVTKDGMPLLDRLQHAYLEAQQKRKNARARRKKMEEKQHEQHALQVALEAKRKRQAEAAALERRRKKSLMEASEQDELDRREQAAKEKEQQLREQEDAQEKERRALRLAMRRASIARDEDFKAAIRAAKAAEKEAASQAQERIDTWDPEHSVFSGRGVGQHAGFFDSDTTCQQVKTPVNVCLFYLLSIYCCVNMSIALMCLCFQLYSVLSVDL